MGILLLSAFLYLALEMPKMDKNFKQAKRDYVDTVLLYKNENAKEKQDK